MTGKGKKVVMLFGQRNRWRVSSICMIMSQSLIGFSILAGTINKQTLHETSGSAKHHFRTPTHITYCPHIQGRRLQYWNRWRSRCFTSFINRNYSAILATLGSENGRVVTIASFICLRYMCVVFYEIK